LDPKKLRILFGVVYLVNVLSMLLFKRGGILNHMFCVVIGINAKFEQCTSIFLQHFIFKSLKSGHKIKHLLHRCIFNFEMAKKDFNSLLVTFNLDKDQLINQFSIFPLLHKILHSNFILVLLFKYFFFQFPRRCSIILLFSSIMLLKIQRLEYL
jgi:hypothetical protein